MSKVERISRIKDILIKHNGKQIGGKDSTRVEVDLSMILELMELEDRIEALEKYITSIVIEGRTLI